MADYREGDSDKERHFLLRLLSVANFTTNGPMPDNLVGEYKKYTQEETYCTQNIIRALRVMASKFATAREKLVDFSSQEYDAKIEELSKMPSREVLEFLLLYSLKSGCDFHKSQLANAPTKFFNSMVGFLEKMRESGCCGEDFWKRLDEAAAEIIAGEPNPDEPNLEEPNPDEPNLEEPNLDENDPEQPDSSGIFLAEKQFILAVIKYIYSLNSKDFESPAYWKRFTGIDTRSLPDLDQRYYDALKIENNDLRGKIWTLGSLEAVLTLYRDEAFQNFYAQVYLYYCVVVTNALFMENESGTPRVANRVYGTLLRCYTLAKKEEEIRSLDDLMEGAEDIIRDERIRRATVDFNERHPPPERSTDIEFARARSFQLAKKTCRLCNSSKSFS